MENHGNTDPQKNCSGRLINIINLIDCSTHHTRKGKKETVDENETRVAISGLHSAVQLAGTMGNTAYNATTATGGNIFYVAGGSRVLYISSAGSW